MSSGQRRDSDRQAATEALMATSRLVTGVLARTLADIDQSVTVPQLRVMVMLHYNERLNLGAIAEGLGVNPSNASRACDKLVASGLISRQDDARNRRRVNISLTAEGRQLVSSLMDRRRELLDEVVSKMAPVDQRHMARGLAALLATLGEDDESVRLGTSAGAMPWMR